jgi:predicted aconitase
VAGGEVFHSQARYFRVNRHDLVYLKFILEAYEGLATLSTVESEGAVVRIGYPHFSAADLDALLLALSGEIEMTEVPMPAGHVEGLPRLPVRKVAEHA